MKNKINEIKFECKKIKKKKIYFIVKTKNAKKNSLNKDQIIPIFEATPTASFSGLNLI